MSAVIQRLPSGQQDLLLGRVNDDRGFIHVPGDIEGLYGDIQKFLSIEVLRQYAARHPELGLVDASETQRAEAAEFALRGAEVRAENLENDLSRIKGLARQGMIIQRANRPLKEMSK